MARSSCFRQLMFMNGSMGLGLATPIYHYNWIHADHPINASDRFTYNSMIYKSKFPIIYFDFYFFLFFKSNFNSWNYNYKLFVLKLLTKQKLLLHIDINSYYIKILLSCNWKQNWKFPIFTFDSLNEQINV